ncbi:serine hydrolase domain-containing protein [Cellulomonas sp.]|uniref:serine hydrolase domain-containing protein n=1 Tax=Cellulomonas sp. TaxID=40001 RepID=UPI002812512B|nr:serine hydrolase domain-containing protein [Cellulomonas sp.]
MTTPPSAPLTAPPPAPPPAGRPSRLQAVVAGALALVVLVVGVLVRPRTPAPDPRTTGDPALAAALREAVAGTPAHRLAVAHVEAGTATFAGLGADESTVFEIGSVSKGLTGLLLADAVERGEVALEDPLGAHLPLDGAPAADVRLGSLATHASGLPRMPGGLAMAARSIWSGVSGANPYGGYGVDALVAAARDARVGDPDPEYSNLGAALAGQALAAAAGTAWPDLLRARLTGPLGMDATTAPARTPADDPLLAGTDASGRSHAPWVMDGFAPAGGVRSTTGDLALLVQALLDGTAPGTDALEPRADLDEDRIGHFWVTSTTSDGRTVTWHNGRTGGFAAWIGLDREAGRGVVVLSDVSASVDEVGLRLLEEGPTW